MIRRIFPYDRPLRCALTAMLLVVGESAALHAQRADSAKAAVARPARKTTVDTSASATPQPPLSPRRAFLYSLLIPGVGQARLGRPTAGALFVFTESIAWAMLRESAADLREARKFRTDSLIFIGNDPATGAPVMQKSPYNDGLVNIRRGHVEDWIAFLVGNHMFAAADAYVAAHLWDLPSQIDVTQTSAGTMVVARVKF